MKRLMLFALLGLASCQKNDCDNCAVPKEDAIINYFLTVKKNSTYRSISFQFDHVRAHRKQNSEIRTVYLESKKVRFDLDDPREIALGSSSIEPEEINGYDFGLGQFVVTKNNESFDLVQPFYHNDYQAFSLEPSEGEEIDVIFILDIGSSIELDTAGQNFFRPQITVQSQ